MQQEPESDPGSEDPWADHVEEFVDRHYSSLRGRVRTHVVHQHLVEHLPAPPARIVDVDGGAGHQSIPLARLGHDVTIADPSPAMLERARQRLDGEDAAASESRPVRPAHRSRR
ncbi:MAG: hypothetical protein U5K30_12225 [Acidimicrobiales bacterium]|nr:hypothetical protein [Acidimicrobiales bacterium]